MQNSNVNGFHPPETSPLLIEAHGLAKTFGEFQAVKEVSLQVRAGEVLALLGHNGAGKTTTTRMLAAILQPTEGYARIAGYDTVRQPLEVRRVIGHLTEQPGLYNRMRVLEYLKFFGELQSIPKNELQARSEALLRRFDLWDTRKLRMGEYSKGMRQKAALIRALLHEPQVLFLDEPTSAMDPYSAKMVRDAISDLKLANRAIILCTHNLVEAEILADRIALIRKGEIVIEGTSEQLKHKLLGVPNYRVELNQPLTELPPALLALPGIRIVERERFAFVFQAEHAQEYNPLVWRALNDSGISVVTLSEVSRSLEAVYLKIAGDPALVGSNRDEVEQSMLKEATLQQEEVLK